MNKRILMKQIFLFIMILLALTALNSPAQTLAKMTVEAVPEGEGVVFVVRNANESILVVHSNIPVMTFEANITQDEPLPGMVFVDIPAGTFTIGSPINEKGREIDEKQIQVTLNGFQMMTTEVTQAMWVALMGDNPSYWKGDNLPVEQVSWNDCQDFIIKLNQRDPGKNYRLPSEAEWEYACRAGSVTRFHSGNQNSDLDLVGWYGGNSNGKPHPVGQKQPNVWGLYDMHGNVFEWCQDWYSSYTRPRDSSSGFARVYRSGCWSYDANGCRSASRGGIGPSGRGIVIGFRLARDEGN